MAVLELAKKPCFSSGHSKRSKLVSNLLPVTTLPKVLYHYSVSIAPEVPRQKIMGIFHRLVQSSDNCNFTGVAYAFDGINMLVTDRKLNSDTITIQSEYGNQNIIIEMMIQYKAVYQMSDLVKYMKEAHDGNINTHIQCLEVIIRDYSLSKYVRVGSKSFDLNKFEPLTNKILMHVGLTQTFKLTPHGLHNNIDLAYYLSYAPLNLVDVISDMSSRSDRSYSRSFEFDEGEIAKRFLKQDALYRSFIGLLKSVRIQTTHRAGRSFSFKAAGLSTESANKILFRIDDKDITVDEYFANKYAKLKYPNLPCVIKMGRDKMPIYFPIETLKIAERQRYEKKLTEYEVAEMIKITAKQPVERFRKIKELIDDMQVLSNESLAKFNLTIGNEYRKCAGILIDPPTIAYGTPGNIKITPENGSWNMRNCSAIKGSKIQSWLVAYLVDTHIRNNDIHTAIEALIHYGKKFGVMLNPIYNLKSVTKPSEYVHLIDTYKPDLVVFILPTQHRNEVYTKIKTISETDNRKVITQCIKQTNFKKLLEPSFAANILIKINSKLRGKNWVLSDDILKHFDNQQTIIFGADVCHSGVGEDMLDSVAAVTASMDATFTDYNVEIQYQKKSEEIITNLGNIVRKLLVMHYTQTKKKPSRIIFFRDGVGESQYNDVLENEVAELKRACKMLEEKYTPKITYIIAQKRHNVRFMVLDEKYHTNYQPKHQGNPKPGTVIEDLSHPFVFDFYMISHNAFQGTARPVRYGILYDESCLTREILYIIINSLCYTYARSTKSISIVTPIMYAHLAAGRGKLYLKDDKSNRPKLTEELKSTCFYN